MKYFINFVLAILLTSISYVIGSLVLSEGILMWQALIIGISVVTLGAITEAIKAPIWLIIVVPFPVGMSLLFIFLNEPFLTWLLTYLITLVIYSFVHILVSYFFKFHSLIPAWKLS
ncbi:hypothetical protein ACERJO_00705 [Halalkalibacter sp. AB-rgal2]|uniref:hypothetical protein n=1 Tax=Halalkalibacter sp. AB-rgal2 TaxID=3242695 RepID=UPI00359D615B